MSEVIQFLKEINIGQLIAMIITIWFFYSRLNDKIEKLDKKIDLSEAKLTARIDYKIEPLYSSIKDIDNNVRELDKRLYAIETVLHMKDCCVLKQDQNLKRAE